MRSRSALTGCRTVRTASRPRCEPAVPAVTFVLPAASLRQGFRAWFLQNKGGVTCERPARTGGPNVNVDMVDSLPVNAEIGRFEAYLVEPGDGTNERWSQEAESTRR
jgi:hypothetical protein